MGGLGRCWSGGMHPCGQALDLCQRRRGVVDPCRHLPGRANIAAARAHSAWSGESFFSFKRYANIARMVVHMWLEHTPPSDNDVAGRYGERSTATNILAARTRRGSRLDADLIGLLGLVTMGFVGPAAIAQDVAGYYRWGIEIDPTVLAVELEQATAAKPDSDFKDCVNGCPVMIVIPAGKFVMGSPENESDRDASEGPAHDVTVSKPFAVSKFTVTFEEWDACVAASACPRVPDAWGRGDMPVINVSFSDAKQYVGWLSQVTGKEYRLPTEAEWEYAARAGAKARYSWGDDLGTDNANCDGCGSQWDLQQTAPVGSFKPNGFGLYDMHGNVWEWVEDSWHDTYDGAPTDGSAWLRDGDPSYRVVRGGSWRNETAQIRAAIRARRNANVRFDTLGLRVARTIRP
jgi:formylglycine-generating enzyme required for sulfatase activity